MVELWWLLYHSGLSLSFRLRNIVYQMLHLPAEIVYCMRVTLYDFGMMGIYSDARPKIKQLSHSTTKQQNDPCAQRRLRSAWTSAESDQSLHCPLEETLGLWVFIEHTAKRSSDLADAQADMSLR